MYKIIKGGAVIGMTEAPNYIKQAANGCFVLCAEEEATGVAYSGAAYHLLGREALGDAETVMLAEVDAGAEMGDVQAAIDSLTVAALMGGAGNV